MTADAAADDDAVVHDLAPDCTVDALTEGERYLGTVDGVVEYGVFVELADDVSGLVHSSGLTGDYDAGDELVVELEEIKANGDLSFAEVDAGDYETRRVSAGTSVDVEAVPEHVGDAVSITGDVRQINQTGGPTIFRVRDGTGLVSCAAFEAAGVRAHPDVEIGDVVQVTGRVESRGEGVQIEVDDLATLEGEAAGEVREDVEHAVAAAATPREVEPLVDWPAMAPLREDLADVARRLRRAVLAGRPIRIRHHADGDGICASVPVQLALEAVIDEYYLEADAHRHLIKRNPSKAPFYEFEDVTRDLNYALADRDRHGQQLPLLCMLDNGSTEEDAPAYEALAHYDVPIVVVDHHHPDPEVVDPLVDAHVNPYEHGEDYRITTGMLCVELARMIAPDLTDELTHVPAVAGLSDHSEAEAMEDYLALAAEAGYTESDLRDIGEALDYATHWLRYDDGRELVTDALGLDGPGDGAGGSADGEPTTRERQAEVVEFLSTRAERDVHEQLDAATNHVEHERLDNGAHLYRLDVENHAHRFTYPAPGKTTGALHDRKVAETGDPVITIGYGPDFAVLRSDGVRLDIPQMVAELEAELPGGGVSGGGHLVVGSIKFVRGMRERVLDALVDKMAEASIDEELGSSGTAAGD